MANTQSVRFKAPKFMPVTGAAYFWMDYCAVAAAASADTFDYVVPAGVEIASVVIQSPALDTNGTPTLAFEVGYTPLDSASTLTPNLTYFAAAGQTTARAGGRLSCAFAPITFQEDIIVRITLTAAAATLAAGNLWAIVSGNCAGPK